MPIITASRRSRCKRCAQWVEVGERIDYTRANGALHVACSDGDDPELEIRGMYARLRSDSTKGGLDFSDQRAFDACVEEFDFVTTVRALYEVSDRARQAQDSYAAMRLKRQGIRMRGSRVP